MRRFLLIILLVAFTYKPAFAQDDATPEVVFRPCDVQVAQAWYDSIDPGNDLSGAYMIAGGGKRLSDRTAAIIKIHDIAQEVESADYPDCVTIPRQWFLDGMDEVISGLQASIDGRGGDYALFAIQASLDIGQFRGYLIALGVETADSTRYFTLK